MSGKWCVVALIYISLIMGKVEQIFVCLRVICIHFIFYKALFLNYRWLCSPGDIWTIWRHFWLSQVEGCAAGISWIDAGGAAKHLMICEAALAQWNVTWLKMLIVPPLKTLLEVHLLIISHIELNVSLFSLLELLCRVCYHCLQRLILPSIESTISKRLASANKTRIEVVSLQMLKEPAHGQACLFSSVSAAIEACWRRSLH